MTVNDINIDSKFQLRALRDDYIHAFVTYFVVDFTACSQRTYINTGKNEKVSFFIVVQLFFR